MPTLILQVNNSTHRDRAYRTTAGYTLMEVIIVVSLLAMLTGGVSMRMTPALRAANHEQALDAVQLLERQTRDACRRHRYRGYLRYSLRGDTVTAEINGSVTQVISLPRSLDLKAVITARGSETHGETEFYIGTAGESESYAVVMGDSNKERIMLFAGVTGKPVRLESNEKAATILANMQRPPRVDAN